MPENFPMAQAVCLLRNKRMTSSDGQRQAPRGDNENLTTRGSCSARRTESVLNGP